MAKHIRTLLVCAVICSLLGCLALPAAATKTTATDRCSQDQERYIWEYFLDLTGSPQATAGIVGNLFFESHLLPGNLETFGKKTDVERGLTYTEAVDTGSYRRFTSDGFGYGLAQWTFPGRKQKLLDLAKAMNQSVGSLEVQLALVSQELEEFNMLSRLRSTDSVDFASDYFMIHFENPKDQSSPKKLERAKVCRQFYEKHVHGVPKDAATGTPLTDMQCKVAAIAKNSEDYDIPAAAGYCQAWANEVYTTAGLPCDPSPSAATSANRFSISDDLSKIPVGAAVYGHSSSEFGHVGIYVGDNKVYHNVGGVAVDNLDDWIMIYDGFSWGWIGGNDLQYGQEDHEDTLVPLAAS